MALLNNWSRSITAWNVALDEKGKPNIGPFPCGGVITVENGVAQDHEERAVLGFCALSRGM